MSPVSRPAEVANVLRLGISLAACGALAGGLLAFGKPRTALGVCLGLALHLANALFLYLSLASIVEQNAPRTAPLVAAASMLARLLFLGFALWLVARLLGRDVALGAAGGLALAQISLLFRRFGAEGKDSCEKSSEGF